MKLRIHPINGGSEAIGISQSDPKDVYILWTPESQLSHTLGGLLGEGVHLVEIDGRKYFVKPLTSENRNRLKSISLALAELTVRDALAAEQRFQLEFTL